jgi:hypothetical protein
MSFNPDGPSGGSQGSSRSNPRGAQGAARGGVGSDDAADESERRSYDPDAAYDRTGRPSSSGDNNPFGGSQYGRRSGGWRSFLGGDAKFLGLPVGLIYAIGGAIIALVFIGAVCGSPAAAGSVAGQVKQLSADRTVTTLAGAQLTLRGSGQTFTTTSTDVDPNAEGEAAYNYRFENVPPGKYALTVAPPAGAALQTEDNLDLEVKSGQLFPQSVMLLAQGIQKPRQLAQNELQPGEAGGYVDDRGQRHGYQQGGFDASDALLMYLLWRNPPYWGYGAPPVIINSPGGSTASNYRVADPPSQTRTGQAVTQQKPSTPGQGSTRPSSGSGATGSAPSRTSGSGDAVAPSTGTGSSGSSSGSGTGSSTSRPSTGTGSSVSAPSAPSQGATRPSSSSSSPARSSAPAPSRSSGSSGGGRR